MSEPRVRFDRVTKKFRRGEWSKALRDAIPAFLGGLMRGRDPETLEADEFYSLRDVSFEVRAGECLGVIGPNGAGKSTTLKLASRILKANQGRVTVKGRVCALIEVGAGFHPDLTGRENIFLNGAILGMRRREIAARFDEIVDFSGMEQFIDTPVKRYSSGMYSRLGFSVAAFMDPDVLLLDEVLSVGDMAFGHKCQRKIQEILRSNAAVIFVSHHLPQVRAICDRAIVLAGGRIDFEGSPDDAIHRYHEILKGDAHETLHPAIRRLGMRLLDQAGQPLIASRPGDNVILEMSMVANRRIREAGLGFFVANERDVEVYSTSMEELGCEPVTLEEGQRLSARFPIATNLLPGCHWLGSIVFGKPDGEAAAGRVTLDRHPNRLQWSVCGALEGTGTSNLFATCDTLVDQDRIEPGGPRAEVSAAHA
jgi:lipopolysaccharide transport system ATP-binding protein